MKKMIFGMSALLAVALLLPNPSEARRGRGRGMMRLLRALNLSDAQWQQVDKLREQRRSATASTRIALRQKRRELRRLWKTDAPSKAAILAKHAEMDPLRAKIREARVDFRLGVHGLLTAAQRTQAKQLIEHRMRRWRRWRKGPGKRHNRK